MSSPILFSRLISRISRLPTQPFFVPRQNFISITVDNEFVKQSEKQLKEENEQAEVDVSEFGSDPYPFWRKVFMLPFILAYMNIHRHHHQSPRFVFDMPPDDKTLRS